MIEHVRLAVLRLAARVCPKTRAPVRTAALLTATMLTACGGSSAPAPSGQPTPTGTAAATATQNPASTATSSSTTTSTSPVAAIPACTASRLRLVYQGSNGAVGTLALYFAMRNTSTTPCHTYGYPGVLFLAGSGVGLRTKAARTTHDPLGSTPPRAIVIAPGGSAGFRLIANLSAEAGTGAGCATAGGLQAIAPDDTATLRVRIPGGVPECGIATLSPLLPGSAIPPGT